MKRKLLLTILLATILSLHSANVKFYSINSLYGISMREATSVRKDNKGFIWASTKTGILRIAGDDYRVYQLPYENVDIFTVKLTYTHSNLLVYTNNGQLFKYNELEDRFNLVVSMTKVLKNKYVSVSSVLMDDAGSYWVASTYGLLRFQNGRFTRFRKEASSYNIVGYKANQLFLTEANGIKLFNTQTHTEKWLYKFNPTFRIRVSKLYYDDKAKKLWIGTTTNGLFIYDMNNGVLSQVKNIPTQPVLAIQTSSDASVLVGIDGQGVWKISRDGQAVMAVYKEDVNDPSSLRGNGVYDIFNDENKRIWVSTYTGGVSFFDQTTPLVDQIVHQNNNQNSLVNNNVNKILQDSKGNIWLATDNGISCKDAKSGDWKTYYHNQLNQATVFLSLCEDNEGRIWAGTYSSGIYVLDRNSGRELAHYTKSTPESLLRTNFVFDIFKDCEGDLMIGGVDGNLVCYQTKEKKFKEFSPLPISAFAQLSESKILLACTYGLCVLDKKTGKSSTLLDGYMVQDMVALKDNIWICTSGDGVIQYNQKTRKTRKVTTADGLPSNYVNSIMWANGYLWLGTESGLCRLNPKDMSVLTYNSVYPLSRVSFNRSAHCQLADGQLMWGTSNGAVRFSTESLISDQSKGVIYFQNLTLAGRSIRSNLTAPLDSLQEIAVTYNQNTLHLELLSIGNVSDAKFSWTLDGFDTGWSQPSGNRSIHYSNIPSGNYVLKIRLYDSSLSRIIAERSLSVTVIPPFWKAWWFEILLLAFIVSVVYMSLRYYIERLKQQHTEEKVRFFTNTAHDIRTSLTLIKAPIEELANERDLTDIGKYYLALATEQARRLSTVVTQLMDFQKVDIRKEQLTFTMVDIVALIEHRRVMFESFAKSLSVSVHFTSNQRCYQTAIDESMIEKVVDNLISNAIKYSLPQSEVHISLKCEPESWTLEVKDSGIGISPKAQRQLFSEFYRGENAINSKIVGSGIGLLLVKNYVEMHNGTISCVSQENVGSTFKIVVPYVEIFEEPTPAIVKKESEPIPLVVAGVDSKPLDAQQDSPKQKMRILIVEDNDDLRNFMQYPLQADFEVVLAENGEDAWRIIQKKMPDLVVSDVMMPKMDGFELCRLIKSTYETSHIPVILLTALSGKAEQLHGLGLGADDYLTKPFDMMLLMQRIKSIIKNREAVKDKALKLIKGSDNDNERILTNGLNDDFVRKMLDVVRANMANTEFGKEDFASAMNVSTSLLYKKVKSLTDQSPTDFIKLVRLDYALELLQSHKYSVTEVSELCGFSSNGYFSTVFKKHFGKSPNEI